MLTFHSFIESRVKPSWAKSHDRVWVYAGKYRITNTGCPAEPEWYVSSVQLFRDEREAQWWAYRIYMEDYKKQRYL